MYAKTLTAGVAALSLVAAQARAGDKPGSDYLQCDGKPAAISLGETLAMIVAITATAGVVGGVVGAPETPDATKRTEGEVAAKACTAALAKETNPQRRVELTLGRAIHEMEAGRLDDALADVRSADTIAGKKAEDPNYQRSLHVSALDLEAMIQTWQGKPAEAEATALKMSALSPYDVINQMRAASYIGLTAEMTPAKREYFDRVGRIWPESLVRRADADAWAGDFGATAADYEAVDELVQGFSRKKDTPGATLLARASAARMLNGEIDKSDALAERARARIDTLMGGGEALSRQNDISQAEELLDFQAIARRLAKGDAAGARVAFGARSRWVAPSAPFVAALTAKLREGADAAQLTGALARDPATLRAEGLSARAKALTDNSEGSKALFSRIRGMFAGPNGGVTRQVWKTEKSPFLVKRKEKDTYEGDFISLLGQTTQPTGEAILMHCALLARAKGKSGFVLMPRRTHVNMVFVRFGEPGDPGMPALATVNAQTVITALSPLFPQPSTQ